METPRPQSGHEGPDIPQQTCLEPPSGRPYSYRAYRQEYHYPHGSDLRQIRRCRLSAGRNRLLVAKCLYGSDSRIMEAARIRVKDINCQMQQSKLLKIRFSLGWLGRGPARGYPRLASGRPWKSGRTGSGRSSRRSCDRYPTETGTPPRPGSPRPCGSHWRFCA